MILSLLSLAALTLAPLWQAAPPAAVPPAAVPPAAVSAPAELAPIDPAVWTTRGARIPDVELPAVDGSGLVRLKDYEGKKLLLIHFASW